MKYKGLLYLLGGLLLVQAVAISQVQAGQASLKKLEYFERWTQGHFPAAFRNPLLSIGSEQLSELPPQYQHAFSLVLVPDSKTQTLNADYHSQMVYTPSTHKHSHKQFGKADYQRLLSLSSGKLGCEAKVPRGWSGPAPKMLALDFGDHQDLLYTSGPGGPSGPSEALDKQDKRRYLCKQDLVRFLDDIIHKIQH